jgi:release factor glutamine methyltransferase
MQEPLMAYYPKKAYFGGYIFEVDKHVYEPAEDTFLIAEKMDIKNTDVALEVGTGCGILAVLAAKKAKKVVAVDINPYAVECANRNVKANNVTENLLIRQGDLFESLKEGEQFSLILFNSPYLPSEPDEEKSWIGKAWAGGADGRRVIERFITDVPKFLLPEGRILLVQSSLSDPQKTVQMFKKVGLKAEVIGEEKFAFETIVLVEAKR